MTETPEAQRPDDPAAPTPKRPDTRVRPAETEAIPPSARVDYMAPDGSADAGEGKSEDTTDEGSPGNGT